MQNKDRDEQRRRNGREFRREPDTTGRFDAPEHYDRIGGREDEQRMDWSDRSAPQAGSRSERGYRGGDRMRFEGERTYRGPESWGYGAGPGERGEDGYQRSMRGDIDRDRSGMRNQSFRNDNRWSPYNDNDAYGGDYYGRGEFREEIAPRQRGGYQQGQFQGGGYQGGGYQGGGYQGGGYQGGGYQGAGFENDQFPSRARSGGIGPQYGQVGPREEQGFYGGQNRSGQYGGGSFEGGTDYDRRSNRAGGGDIYGNAGYGSNDINRGPIQQGYGQRGRVDQQGYPYDQSAAGGYGRTSGYGQMTDYGRVDYGGGSYDQFGGQPGGRNFRGVGPKNYNRSPDSIRNDLCERLTDHPALDPSKIEVDVEEDGVVHLKGKVDSRRSKRMIEDEADHIRGVVDVRNELEIADEFYRTSNMSAHEKNAQKQSTSSSNGESKKSSSSSKKKKS